MELHTAGKLEEATRQYLLCLRGNPNNVSALHLLGVAEAQRGLLTAAVHHLRLAAELAPGSAEVLSNYGLSLSQAGRHDDALPILQRALLLQPRHPAVLYNLGSTLSALRRYGEALENFEAALALVPGDSEFLIGMGNALRSLGRLEAALECYDAAIAADHASLEALGNRCHVLCDLRRHENALAAIEAALALNPRNVDLLQLRGVVLFHLARITEALGALDDALAMQPQHVACLMNRGEVLASIHRHDEAVRDFELVEILEPDRPYLRGQLLHSQMHCCDWRNFEQRRVAVLAEVRKGIRAATPFVCLTISDSPEDQLTCARIWARDLGFDSGSLPPALHRADHDRIRLAYLSSDFRNHPVAVHMAWLIERHDRARFEVTGLAHGADDGSPMRRRLREAFDRFVDISAMDDQAVAGLIRSLEIDVLVDLTGHTANSRVGVLAKRPAPVQVSFLGFAGTLGSPSVDYIIADRTVIPEEDRGRYAEKIAFLPDCFLPNEEVREFPSTPPARRQVGLPDASFVFCAFNNFYKITPDVFAVWMRLLKQVDRSVLWLRTTSPLGLENLRRVAASLSVDPSRLIFAGRTEDYEGHLSRFRQADLFLDTLPYNAHATACDALRAGVPVVTCLGNTFAGRVAASALNAVGLPMLVARTLAEYESLALKLARDRTFLSEVREQLKVDRNESPLFDPTRFVRHIEAAYSHMWQRAGRGEKPEAFAVLEPLKSPEPRHQPTVASFATENATRRSLLVEGWRFVPHSYAIVNECQLLALSSRRDLDIVVKDLPYYETTWVPTKGLRDPGAEESLRKLPVARAKHARSLARDPVADAALRIAFPYDLSPAAARRTCVFMTSEFGIVPNTHMAGGGSFRELFELHRPTIITPSQWSRAGIVASGADPAAVKVVPHGVDPDMYRPLERLERERQRLARGWHEDDVVYLTVGALTANKGIGLLLTAFARVLETVPRARLAIKGLDGLYHSRDRLQVMLDRLDGRQRELVLQRLSYIGDPLSFRAMANLYQVADVYVSPYLAEGFNLPVLEAAACGTAVICSEGGPTDEFTQASFALRVSTSSELSGQAGFERARTLCPNLDHLVNRMLYAADHPEFRNAAREAGPFFVRRHHTWDRVVAELCSVMFDSDPTIALY